ncbi:MAG: hypothetical protein JHC98_12180 [Thermoleophilaceae bacterium]|nr:hypothetical protein [Thermoleophilaceae bacterium]
MPYSGARKPNAAGDFHQYNRARPGLWLFHDDEDRFVFEEMMNRHLSRNPHFDSRGRQYVNLRDSVRLRSRCLMSSHFHNVLNQLRPGGMAALTRRVIAAYTQYHHQRHGSTGSLFAGEYRARRLLTAEDLRWCTAYVHDNHPSGLDYRFSTHRLYMQPEEAPSWLEVDSSLGAFGGLDGYKAYLRRRSQRRELDLQLRGPQRRQKKSTVPPLGAGPWSK